MRHKAMMKHEVLGLDFIHDTTVGGRSLKMLVVLDDYTHECLALEVEWTFRGGDVVAVLDELTAIRGAPVHIRSGNGPELVSKVVPRW
jgi:putative transposase